MTHQLYSVLIPMSLGIAVMSAVLWELCRRSTFNGGRTLAGIIVGFFTGTTICMLVEVFGK